MPLLPRLAQHRVPMCRRTVVCRAALTTTQDGFGPRLQRTQEMPCTSASEDLAMSAVEVAKKFEISVVYNGMTQTLSVEPHEQVNAVRERAIHLFHITQAPHLLSLFREDGTEVPDNVSVAAAGVKPGELLALRPSAVKGG